MTSLRSLAARFVRDETGALTVEYVLLAAAVTALGIGSSDVINRGLAALAGNVDSELSGDPVTGIDGMAYDDGFDDGAAGWSGAAVSNVRGFGNVLGPIAGSGGAEAVSKEFDVAPGAKSATIKFDLIAGDSLDGEDGIVYLNGREVGRLRAHHSEVPVFRPSSWLEEEGISISAQVIDSRVNLGGSVERPDWRDSRTAISISIANPTEKVRFGFGSNANSGVDDEFFAIDNFKAAGLQDPARAQ